MTVKEMIERLEKVEDKNIAVVTSDYGIEIALDVCYDIIDIIKEQEKNEEPHIILMTDKWNRLKEVKQ